MYGRSVRHWCVFDVTCTAAVVKLCVNAASSVPPTSDLVPCFTVTVYSVAPASGFVVSSCAICGPTHLHFPSTAGVTVMNVPGSAASSTSPGLLRATIACENATTIAFVGRSSDPLGVTDDTLSADGCVRLALMAFRSTATTSKLEKAGSLVVTRLNRAEAAVASSGVLARRPREESALEGTAGNRNRVDSSTRLQRGMAKVGGADW